MNVIQNPDLKLRLKNPLAFFLSMPHYPKFYWHDGQKAFHKMAFSEQCSFKIKRFSDLAQILQDQKTQWPCFGASLFNINDPKNESHWFIPELYVDLQGDQANFYVSPGSSNICLEDCQVLSEVDPLTNQLNIKFKGFDFEEKSWAEKIAFVKTLYKNSDLKKIVLARRSFYTIDQAQDLYSLLKPVLYTAKGISFVFQLGPNEIFFGESPETLLSWQRGEFFSEATAGTTGVGKNESESIQLAAQLLQSQKDINEHDFVVQHLEKVFAEFSSTKSKEATDILKLFYAQHLKRQFKGTFKRGFDWGAVADALHPTPAVSGAPSALALKHIAEIEKVSRGYYAAPIGFCHSDYGHLQVAIRSASFKGQELTAYSGAGIMPSSDPAKEWAELSLKLQWLHQPLGITM